MKFSKVLVLVLVLMIVGCTQTTTPKIQDGIYIQYANNNTQDAVTNDLIIPTTVKEQTISWGSNSEFATIVDNRVVINRQNEDIKVTLTASIEVDGKTVSRPFEITILKSTFNFEGLFNSIVVPTATKTSFTIPVTIDGHEIIWTSSNPALISTTGVVFTTPTETEVTLSATVRIDGATRTHNYVINVLATNTFDVSAFKTAIALPSSTTEDLDLAESYLGNAVVWSSSNESVLSSAGLITRQSQDIEVSLTASITVNGQLYAVVFKVMVIKAEVVVPDYAAILNKINVPNQATANLTLPTVIEDVQITWQSNNAAITPAGVVTRQSSDITVTLTAIITENTTYTKTFTVLVPKLADYPVSTQTPIAEVRLRAQGAKVTVHGVITSLMTNGNFTIQDSTGAIPVYMNNNTGLKVGTEYVIEGTLGIFNGLIQISSPTIVQTVGEKSLPVGIDLTGYSLDFDDVILYEANVITYKDLEVTSIATPSNAIELYLKNSAGETTFVRLDKRVNVTPTPFDTIKVGDIVDLFNVTVGQYAAKAQFLFTNRSTIVSRPKNPEIISIYGAVNRNYIIGDPVPNYLEGITARNGYGDDFTSLLGYDAPQVNLTQAGDYEITIYLNNHANVYVTYMLYVRKEIEIGVYEGYYASLNGLTGSSFNAALRSLILSKGSASGSTSQVQSIDRVGNSYYLIYDGMGSYGNREHTWPQSKLGTVKDDLHNLRAANTNTNSSRGNLSFVEDGKTYTGSQPYGRFNGGWYPGDEHIGDVARIILYISIRYNLNIDVVGNLQMFLQWHEMDPVNDFERTRNDRIFGIQNNRNPFIDHPELVEIYFGTGAQKLPVSIALVNTTIALLETPRRYQFA